MGGCEMRLISSDLNLKSYPKVSYETQLYYHCIMIGSLPATLNIVIVVIIVHCQPPLPPPRTLFDFRVYDKLISADTCKPLKHDQR
jgi:hypothetical protein